MNYSGLAAGFPFFVLYVYMVSQMLLFNKVDFVHATKQEQPEV